MTVQKRNKEVKEVQEAKEVEGEAKKQRSECRTRGLTAEDTESAEKSEKGKRRICHRPHKAQR
jgi:hypothetical protein